MKIRFIAPFIVLLVNGSTIAATNILTENYQTLQTDQTESGSKASSVFKQSTLEALYSYIDFKFNSKNGFNFNEYQGHSNLYTVGADQMKLTSTLLTGVYVYEINTVLSSQVLLTPNSLTLSDQSINNKTLFAHLLKIFNPQFYVDVAGGYGQNKVSIQSSIMPDTANQQFGFANYNNHNWYTSLNALYRKVWDKTLLKANVGALYTQVDSGSYPFNYQSNLPPQITTPLTTKTTFLIENAELEYKVTETVAPFITGGLIQVVQFSNSAPIVTTNINGSLPQLNLNQNGYRLGGGVTFTHKQFKVRLEDKYYNAEGVFISNLISLGLEYQFS